MQGVIAYAQFSVAMSSKFERNWLVKLTSMRKIGGNVMSILTIVIPNETYAPESAKTCESILLL